MRKYLALIAIIMISLSATANSVLTGEVKDDSGTTLPGAALVWMSLPEKTIIATGVSDADGRFNIDSETAVAQSCVICSKEGYKTEEVNIDGRVSLTIVLTPVAYELGEVVVKAKSANLKLGVRGFEFNPDDIKEISNSALDMIQYVPLVSTDGRFNFSILGKPVTILINGKKYRLGDGAEMDYLRTVSPDAVKKIEIMTSKDYATGSETALNFIIPDPTEGFFGMTNVEGTWITNGGYRYNGSAFLAYNGNRLQLSGKVAAANSYGKGKNVSDYMMKESGMEYSEIWKSSSHRNNESLSFSAGYDINSRSNIGVTLEAELIHAKGKALQESRYAEPWTANNYQDKQEDKTTYPFPRINATIYYELATDSKGSRLNIDVDYWRVQNKSTWQRNVEYQSTAIPSFFEQNTGNKNAGQNGYVRYMHVFGNNSILNVGYELHNLHKNLDFFSTNAGESNNFVYNELIHTLYAQYSINFNSKFSLSAGAKGEETVVRSERTSEEKYNHSYFRISPELNFTSSFGGGMHILNLEFSSWTQRPYNSELNPFKIWFSPTSYRQGNPYAKSNVGYSFSLRYHFLNDYSVYVNYMPRYRFKGNVAVPEDGGILKYTYGNVGNVSAWGFGFQWERSFFNYIWSPRISASMSLSNRRGLKGYEYLDEKYTSFDFRFQNRFILSRSRNIRMSLQWQYIPKMYLTLGNSRGVNTLFVSFYKNWDIGGNTLEASVYGMGSLWTTDKTTMDNDALFMRTAADTPFSVVISLTYTFGNEFVKKAKNKGDKSGFTKSGS